MNSESPATIRRVDLPAPADSLLRCKPNRGFAAIFDGCRRVCPTLTYTLDFMHCADRFAETSPRPSLAANSAITSAPIGSRPWHVTPAPTKTSRIAHRRQRDGRASRSSGKLVRSPPGRSTLMPWPMDERASIVSPVRYISHAGGLERAESRNIYTRTHTDQ